MKDERTLRAALRRILWTATVLSTSILLALNIISLVLSTPFIIDGIPREYETYVSGSLRLPYAPMTSDGIDAELPSSIATLSPFEVVLSYPFDRVPYGIQYLHFENGMGHFRQVRISLYRDTGSMRWKGGARVPGLERSGNYSVSLLGMDAPKGIELYNVALPNVLEVLSPDVGDPMIMPLIAPDHNVSGPIEVEFWGGMMPEGVTYRFDNGTEFHLSGGSRPMMDPSHLRPGWHLLTISGGGWEGSYPVFREYDAGVVKDAPDLTVEKVFNGSDRTYSQEEMAPLKVIAGSVRLFGNAFHRVSLEYPTDRRGILPPSLSGMEHLLPVHAQGFKIGDRIYPASPSGDHRTWTATVLVWGNSSSFSASAGPLSGGSDSRPRHFTIDVMEDRALEVWISPDPFLPGSDPPASGSWITVSDSGYPLGKRAFSAPPEVRMEGIDLSPAMDKPGGYWTRYSYIISPADLSSGALIELEANATYQLVNGMYLLLPLPPFLFTLFTIPGGLPVVAYFFLIAFAIIGSSIPLLIPSIKAFKKRIEDRRLEEITEGEDGFHLTAMGYTSIIFLSIAVVVMFRIVEQPTPVPGILSSSTPVHFRMLMLAEASVWEEIASRVLYVGVPLAIYNAFKGRKGMLGGLFGGTGRIGRSEIVLILLSASLFGIAHAGWGPWKVLPTFLSGLIFGYLFVKVGLHASIIVHFLIDYASFFWEIVPWAENAQWVYAVLILVFIAVGIFNMGVLLGRAALRIGPLKGRAAIAFAHSILSIIIGAIIYDGSGNLFFTAVFFCAPLPYLIWYAAQRHGFGSYASWLVMMYSPLTLLLAPFGVAFWHVIGEEAQGPSSRNPL